MGGNTHDLIYGGRGYATDTHIEYPLQFSISGALWSESGKW